MASTELYALYKNVWELYEGDDFEDVDRKIAVKCMAPPETQRPGARCTQGHSISPRPSFLILLVRLGEEGQRQVGEEAEGEEREGQISG